jgi:hypothetical protein
MAYPILTESEFDNLLVHQKDAIIDLINNGQTIAAQAALAVVSELWIAHSYEYKIRELTERINRARARIDEVD